MLRCREPFLKRNKANSSCLSEGSNRFTNSATRCSGAWKGALYMGHPDRLDNQAVCERAARNGDPGAGRGDRARRALRTAARTLLEALAETSVLSPSQRSKFGQYPADVYPATFPQRLMFKDFGLILQRALELAVAMPATAAAAQVAATERAREAAAHVDDDLSAVVRR